MNMNSLIEKFREIDDLREREAKCVLQILAYMENSEDTCMVTTDKVATHMTLSEVYRMMKEAHYMNQEDGNISDEICDHSFNKGTLQLFFFYPALSTKYRVAGKYVTGNITVTVN